MTQTRVTMANELIPFETEDGTTFFVEIEEEKGKRPITRGGKGKKPEDKAPGRFAKALAPLKPIVGMVMSKISEIKESPEEVTLEMGIKLTAEAGVILTQAGGEAHFKLTIKWKDDPTKASGK